VADPMVEQLRADRAAALKDIEKIDGLLSRLEGGDADEPMTTDLGGFMGESLLDWEWLFGGVVPTGSTGMLAGDPKSGKSTLITQMALCLAAGRDPFYDCRVSRAGRILYIAAEGARAAYQNRVRTAASSLGISLSRNEATRWFIQKQKVSDYMLGSAGLHRMVAETKPDLLVLDTLGYFHRGNENDATDWKRHVMHPCRALTAEFGCAVLLVHHQTKESAERKGAQRVRGTTAMTGDCDYLLQLDNVPGDDEKKVLQLSLTKYAQKRRWDLRYQAADARFG
jgi:RecA-family ATPase